jgi:Xaa-Pro aminopeptidase
MNNASAGAISDLITSNSLDAVALFNCHNLRYLCGFTGTDGVLLVWQDSKLFLTDSRYVNQAREQVGPTEVREYQVKLEGVTEVLISAGVKRVGFEADFLSYAQVEQLRKHSDGRLEWVALGKAIQRLRSRKTAAEADHLAAAAQLAAQAFQSIVCKIRPGQTEAQLARDLEVALLQAGGEEKAFDFIIASGARGAMPHGVASSKQLIEGELVTIDYGVRLNGYYSDETVTLALGNISSKMREIFDIVLSAHDLAIDRLRPGMKLTELDACARDYIAAKGYGDYFGHGLGHGVGLEVHEFPSVSPRSEDVVEEGMVLTIEPGIYLPGEGGARIEDMIYVTADGGRILTELPKHYRNLLS